MFANGKQFFFKGNIVSLFFMHLVVNICSFSTKAWLIVYGGACVNFALCFSFTTNFRRDALLNCFCIWNHQTIANTCSHFWSISALHKCWWRLEKFQMSIIFYQISLIQKSCRVNGLNNIKCVVEFQLVYIAY